MRLWRSWRSSRPSKTLKRLLPKSVMAGLCAAPAMLLAAQLPTDVCESRAFEEGVFRAYANPKPVSAEAFTTQDGKKIKLDSLPGPRALLVNFWTTWCTPCIKEMPSMDRLQGRVSRDQLLILPLVRDGKGLSQAARFYQTHEINNLPVAADRFGKISHDHQIGPVPQTLFVGSQGLVKGILVGGVDWESDPMLELLNNCLHIRVE